MSGTRVARLDGMERHAVNNAIYSQLGERWYEANDDPVALLRAESRLRTPWMQKRLSEQFPRPCDVLDVGCGAGFLANQLARDGHRVVGLDTSSDSLGVAQRYDSTQRVRWQCGDALALPFARESFDAVCLMDVLEHVEEPARAVAESAGVLAPGGLLFFNTYNRNWLSWLVAIKGVEWFVSNTPRHLHVLRLFIKPAELVAMCEASELDVIEVIGTRPRIGRAMLHMLVTGTVPDDFDFTFTGSTALGYAGMARKRVARSTGRRSPRSRGRTGPGSP